MNLAGGSEYLVRLGFVTDTPGFSRFQATLRDATRLVDGQVSDITSSLLKAQAIITGGFASVGTAALGLADKVAQADQEYRLFGLRMYMTQSQAKSLKIAMDALGQPLENIAWDPELHERFNQLVTDQHMLQRSLGGDFEGAMKRIRDIRFELTRLQVETQYLGMGVTENIFKAMGLDPGQVLARLRELNDWVITHMPEITTWVADHLTPVFGDMRDVLGQTWDLVKLISVAFTNLIGLLSGDHSIEGTAFSFEHLTTAIQHAVHGAAVFVETMISAEELLLHFVNATAFGLSGNTNAAIGELQQGLKLVTAGTGAVLGAAGAGPAGALAGAIMGAAGGPAGAIVGFGLGGTLGAGLGAGVGAGIGSTVQGFREGTGPNSGAMNRSVIRGLIDMAASRFGIDPAIAHAIANQESGETQFTRSGNILTSSAGALGVMQLMPATARGLGVDPYDAGQNVSGGMMLFRDLMKRYGGNLPEALAAYNWNPSGVDKVLAGKATLPDETRNYVASILAQTGRSGDMQIGSVTIHVMQPNASPQQIQQAVTQGVRDAQNKQTQRNLAEFNSQAWSY